jgi:hypothetical protein
MPRMGLRTLLPALAATLVLLAAAAHAADEALPIAVPLPPHPTAAVGVILRDGTGMCTGSLIAPDLILTAAHCVVSIGPEAIPRASASAPAPIPGSLRSRSRPRAS